MFQSTNPRQTVIQSSSELTSLAGYKPLGSMSQGIPLLLQAWGAQSIQQPPATSKVLTDLSAHLGKDVFDIDAFGTVPELINEMIQDGTETASFLVTDLTSVVDQYD